MRATRGVSTMERMNETPIRPKYVIIMTLALSRLAISTVSDSRRLHDAKDITASTAPAAAASTNIKERIWHPPSQHTAAATLSSSSSSTSQNGCSSRFSDSPSLLDIQVLHADKCYRQVGVGQVSPPIARSGSWGRGTTLGYPTARAPEPCCAASEVPSWLMMSSAMTRGAGPRGLP